VNCFGLHLYWGRGNNIEGILLVSPVADLYLSFRMQECRNNIDLHGGWDTHSSALGYQIQHTLEVSKIMCPGG
jgi:hypothetical protein